MRELAMAANRKQRRIPWNKERVVGQKAPLKLREIWNNGVRDNLSVGGQVFSRF
jgi:hypothetical protein